MQPSSTSDPPSPSDRDPAVARAPVVRFGVFEVDLGARELRKRGVRVRLADQPFQILELLLEHPGEVVTRDGLRQRLWPADTFVDFDLSLNSAVRKLREALGDSAEHPRYIETLPRRGYRLIVPVEGMSSGGKAAAKPTSERRASAAHFLWAGMSLLAVAAAAIMISRTVGRETEAEAGVPPHIRSIAVLPLENLTGDPDREYFVDGMTDALITELAQLGNVSVISRTSSMQYKRTKKPLSAIARELKVDAIVEGAVGASGGRVRMTARLTAAPTDQSVWGDSFERDTKDVMSLQAEVARAIAVAVGNSGASGSLPPMRRMPEVNPEAYDLFLNGVREGGRVSYEGAVAAVSYFERAIARQPDFARAHAGYALARIQYLYGGPMAPDEILPEAETAARKAVTLDPTLADAHRVLAIIHRVYGRHDAADKEIRQVLALAPATADALGLQAGRLIRAGRSAEAVVMAERARELDPLSVNRTVAVAEAFRAAGQPDRAIAELRRAIQLDPARPNLRFQLGATHALGGDIKQAIAEFERAIDLSTIANPRFRAYLAHAYAMDGREQKARRILQELLAMRRSQYVSLFGIALIHDALGEKDAAMAALQRAYQEHAVEFTQLHQYPAFRTLASEPQYRELMRRTNPEP